MQLDLTDKVAVITGASRGIGKAIAAAYARAGAAVVLASRKQDDLDRTAAEIQAAGGQVMALAAHVGDEAAVTALVERALERFGRIDIAVANAGTNPHFGPTLEASAALWDKIMEVNLRGAFLLCKAVVPHMQPGGKIVIMSSVAGLRPSSNLGIYSVSKAGLNMLTQVLAAELGPDEIRVNAIAPGTIKTRFSRVLYETKEIADRLLGRTPLGYLGEPDDVVGAALFLASPLSDYVSGAVLTVDGGVTAAGGLG